MNMSKDMIIPLLDVIPPEDHPFNIATGQRAKSTLDQRVKRSKFAKLIATMTDDQIKILIMALSHEKVLEAIKYKDRSCNDIFHTQPEALRRELMRRASIVKIAEGD